MTHQDLSVLKNKKILITGSSRGIGKQVALLAAKNHATVAINYATNQSAAETTASMVDDLGGNSIILHADVSRENQVDAMMGQIMSQFGGLDILINNAGILSQKLLQDESIGNLHRVIDVNVKSVINTTYCTTKIMKSQTTGGVIVNIASDAGTTGYPHLAVYSASKFAVIGFTQAIAQELETDNIRVYAVSPTTTATDMTHGIGVNPKLVAEKILSVALELENLKSGENLDLF